MEDMSLILDSSIIFQMEKGDKKIIELVESLSEKYSELPRISFMSLVEFLVGYEGHNLEKKVRAKEFIWKFPVLHTTNTTAFLLSSLKYKYTRLGKQKSITDLFIASQALEQDLTLATMDKDFADMSELKKIIL